MEILRLMVTGSVGAGKTSFIRTISEIDVVNTDKISTDEIATWKGTTTVALDFGRLNMNPEQAIHLYGTPGQLRFDFIWDMLIQKAQAYIFLVDAHRPQDFPYSRRILNFMNQRVEVPYLIGVTHSDCSDACKLEDIALALGFNSKNTQPPMMFVNATDKASIFPVLTTLIDQLSKSYSEYSLI